MIRIENVCAVDKPDGRRRFLVERDWPKGVLRSIPRREPSGQAREALATIQWRPELAPSRALRQWFRRAPARIRLFRDRYFRELQRKKSLWISIAQEAEARDVALLYHGSDLGISPARFLKEFLELQMATRRVPKADAGKRSHRAGRGVAVPVEKAIQRSLQRPLKQKAPASR